MAAVVPLAETHSKASTSAVSEAEEVDSPASSKIYSDEAAEQPVVSKAASEALVVSAEVPGLEASGASAMMVEPVSAETQDMAQELASAREAATVDVADRALAITMAK